MHTQHDATESNAARDSTATYRIRSQRPNLDHTTRCDWKPTRHVISRTKTGSWRTNRRERVRAETRAYCFARQRRKTLSNIRCAARASKLENRLSSDHVRILFYHTSCIYILISIHKSVLFLSILFVCAFYFIVCMLCRKVNKIILFFFFYLICATLILKCFQLNPFVSNWAKSFNFW